MNDLISRQAAIDALRYAQHRFTVADEAGGMGTVKWSEDVIYFAAAERVLSDLPSAQPERKRGKWIDYTEDGYVECPFCHSATNCDGNKDELHFCFSCGADMREVNNGQV